MQYTDYIGNVCRLAVDLVNDDPRTPLVAEMYGQHHVTPPAPGRWRPMIAEALAAVADHAPGDRPIGPVNALLAAYPPALSVSDHDGAPHIHFAPDGEEGAAWTARSCGAALAYVMSGDVSVTVGRCAADGCARFFVDDSRNRSRRFCGATCASRTTVAAYRARKRPVTG